MQPLNSKRLMDVKIVSQLKQVDNWLRVPKLVLKDWSCVIGKGRDEPCKIVSAKSETCRDIVRFCGGHFDGNSQVTLGIKI